MGPNNWGIFLTLPVTTGESIGPAGEISPVVCMLKNGLTHMLTVVFMMLRHHTTLSQFLIRLHLPPGVVISGGLVAGHVFFLVTYYVML